MNHSQRIRLF